GINGAARDRCAELRRHVGKDHDGEFQPFGFMDRHQPDAIAAFFEDRCFSGFSALGLGTQLVNKSAKRNAAFRFIATRQLSDMRNIGEHVFATVLERKPDVRAGGFEQCGHGRRHRHPITRAMERLQQLQSLDNGTEVCWKLLGDAKWMKMTDLMAILQKFFVADRKQAPPQGCESRQLIFGPLYSGKRGAQRLDLCAIVNDRPPTSRWEMPRASRAST